MRLHPCTSTEGLPRYEEIIREKYHFALSRFRDRQPDAGFEMYPDHVKGTQYVMGWAGQSDAGGYAMLGLAHRLGDPQMKNRGQRALDWLARSPFSKDGFLLNYNADDGKWKHQDPVSQGQAMEVFARAIVVGRKMKGVKTKRWEEFLMKACSLQAKRILQADWKPVNTAEAFFISPLCKAYQLFGDKDSERAAIKAAGYYAERHLDVFGVVYTPEIWRMGDYLKRDDLKRLAAVMYRSCGQMIDPYGSTGEQIQQTNFAQHGDMSNVFRLRGGYSESWSVFWITAHFLNATSEFERMGVDLDSLD